MIEAYKKILLVFLFLIFLSNSCSAATYYVDSVNGHDDNNGISTSSPWRTISKVDSVSFTAGDSILFSRGETFREGILSGPQSLTPVSGNAGGNITYGAYGTGSKPKILGSVEFNNSAMWKDNGGNIWETKSPLDYATVTGNELLPNTNFDTVGSTSWVFTPSGAANCSGGINSSDYDTAPYSYRVYCNTSGVATSEVQLYTTPINITSQKIYLFTFKAKSTSPFNLSSNMIKIMNLTSPWNNYYSLRLDSNLSITNQYATYKILFKANTNASNTRLQFFLGSIMTNDSSFFIDTLSFKEVTQENLVPLTVDVGNIIFNNEQSVGVKVWNASSLTQQGQFWYNRDNSSVEMYSAGNPALYYSDIELALKSHIIDALIRKYNVFENLDLRYSASIGVSMGDGTNHTVVRDLDISYIGGGNLTGFTRYGNAIQFWCNSSDNVVERNKIWEIYDSALTNQGTGSCINKQYNIYYRNNIVWNADICFEYENRPSTSTTDNIYFENNICINSGYEWSYNQRSPYDPYNPWGRDLNFYTTSANTTNFYVRNNIFYNARNTSLYLQSDSWNGTAPIINNNLFWQSTSSGSKIATYYYPASKYYDFSNFSDYKNDTGFDANSILADPGFVNLGGNDFHYGGTSPAINQGLNLAGLVDYDFDLVSRPQGTAWDIGAYEYVFPIISSNNPSTPNLSPIFIPAPTQLTLGVGYEISLPKSGQFQFSANNETHTIKINDIVNKTAVITVSSNPITFNVTINETKKIDVNDDEYYEMSVFLKNITVNNADLIIKPIYEKIPKNESEEIGESAAEEQNEMQTSGKGIFGSGIKINATALFWGAIGLVALFVVIVCYLLFRSIPRKKFYHKT